MEIQDYPNYLIYENGEVWSKNSNRIRKSSLVDGYLRLSLSNNGKVKHILVHRLIAIHYIPNPDNKPCVDHIDHNRQNNTIENLRWVTTRENAHNKSNQNENIGVCKNGNKYHARIIADGKNKYLGIYDTQEDASIVYQKALDEINNGLPISYKPIPPKSGYKNVYQNGDKYRAYITIDGKRKSLGYYDTPELAQNAIINHMNHQKSLSN